MNQLLKLFPNTHDVFYMAGTEGTGDYDVVLVTDKGRIGVREYTEGCFRLRLEPSSQRDGLNTEAVSNWPKRPGTGGQDRYSVTCTKGNLESMLAQAYAALEPASQFEVNSDAPSEYLSLLPQKFQTALETVETATESAVDTEPSHERLLATARALRVPGVNYRWGVAALKSGIQKVQAPKK